MREVDWFQVILFSVVGFICFMALAVEPNRKYDDTDNGKKRSGLTLYTDNLTGCQYLEAGMIGGITPRLNGKGEHLGCKQSY